jgi:hypothetical protein
MRIQFSVRTLAIFVTLICVYFGAWEATKRYGVAPPLQNREEYSLTAADDFSPIPFIVRGEELDGGCILMRKRTYYVWLLGPKLKLPFESWR